MSNLIRKLVSHNRRRYVDEDFNLDLSYVTDNVIAMAFPAPVGSKRSLIRNKGSQVRCFLDQNHPEVYKVYNLCSEPNSQYDTGLFPELCTKMTMPDHHPPRLKQMFEFCQDADAWLSQSPLHVIAVHCKAGKGRTGTMICAYLMFKCGWGVEEVMDYYASKRTSDGRGVTIRSQIRYLKLFHKVLQCQQNMSNATSSTEGPEPEAASHPPRPGMPPTELVQMTRITLQNFRLARTSKVKMKIKYFDPDTDEDRVFVRFLPLSAVEFAKAKEGRGKDESRKRNDFHIKIPDSLLIAEDFQVQIRTVKRYAFLPSFDRLSFHTWIHSAMFPPPNNQPPGSRDEDCLTLERDQLDCIKGAGSNFQLCIEGYLVHTVAEAIEEGDVTSSVLTE